MSISDPQINSNRLGSVKKITEMRSKVWNIDTKFVVFKNKYEDKPKNLCQIHRSFQTGWGAWKNDRNEINCMDDQCAWLCIRITFSSSIGKVLKLPDG